VRAERLLGMAALACALAPASAHAYCRSTTCNPKLEVCRADAHRCSIDGLPVFWADACIPIWLPTDPEPLPGIDASTFAAAIQASFAAWGAADCAPGGPSIDTRLDGALECALTGYDPDAMQNVNTVRVVEDWPQPVMMRTEIALTTVTSNAFTGEILDADIELNADDNRFSVLGDGASVDLQAALTHEAGHALGLDHSDVLAATMFEAASPGSLALRTLDPDDEAGICAVYPPGQTPVRACASAPAAGDPAQVCRAVVTPRPASTGCSVAAPRAVRVSGPGAPWLACAALLVHRRRRALSARARR